MRTYSSNSSLASLRERICSFLNMAQWSMGLEIFSKEVKTALVPSKLPGTDFVINPYFGCSFGCIYCYASFIGRFVAKSLQDWGEYVGVKKNIVEVLRKELPRKFKEKKGEGKRILLSSVTDPYQPLELKFKLTRSILEELLNFGFRGEVSILTKSDLVLRDADLFLKLPCVKVGLTITILGDDNLSFFFERTAPPSGKRLQAFNRLNDIGIDTYAFIGPVLPHYANKEKELETLFCEVAKTGTKKVFVEALNFSPYIRERMVGFLREKKDMSLLEFYLSQDKEYLQSLQEIVISLCQKYNLDLWGGGVIFHKSY